MRTRDQEIGRLKDIANRSELGYLFDVSDWMKNHFEVPFYCTLIYILFIYFGTKIMKNRKPFNLQYPLALWNFLLASMIPPSTSLVSRVVFSIYGAYSIIPEFFRFWISGDGFIPEICGGDVEIKNPVTMLFCLR
jgi:hypothetical protein